MKTAIRCASAALLALLAAGGPLAGGATAQRRPEATASTPPRPSTFLPVATRWTANLPAPAAAAPVASGDRLLAPLFDGQIAAVSLVDGSELWRVEQTVTGQPAAGGGLFHAATPEGLLALDAETGEIRWAVTLEAPVSAPLLWTAGWLIAALETDVLLAMHAGTGGTIWRQVVDGGVGVRPTIAGDRLYVPLASGRIAVLELLTGAVIWERRLGGAPQEILVAGDLFVGAADNHFYRLSRRDGALRWRWRAGGDAVGRPAVDDERVYFSSLDNTLWALDRSHGGQRWRELLAVRPTAGPRLAEDLIVQGGMTRELDLYGGDDGAAYHGLQVSSELAFAPLAFADPLSDGALLVLVTVDGELQAIGRATGPERLDPAVTTVWERLAPAEGEEGASRDPEDGDASGGAADGDGSGGAAAEDAPGDPEDESASGGAANEGAADDPEDGGAPGGAADEGVPGDPGEPAAPGLPDAPDPDPAGPRAPPAPAALRAPADPSGRGG